jgi:hypothetical protein
VPITIVWVPRISVSRSSNARCHGRSSVIPFPSDSVVRALSVGERATCVSGRAAGLPAFPPELAGPLHGGMPGRFFGTQQNRTTQFSGRNT